MTMTLQDAIQTNGTASGTAKCTYVELYLSDGTKLFSIQSKKFADPIMITDGTTAQIDTINRGSSELVAGTLTEEAYVHICKNIEKAKRIAKYADIVKLLFFKNRQGLLQRLYKNVKVYALESAMEYVPYYTTEVEEDITTTKKYSIWALIAGALLLFSK